VVEENDVHSGHGSGGHDHHVYHGDHGAQRECRRHNVPDGFSTGIIR
jgi:hypothetical protein